MVASPDIFAFVVPGYGKEMSSLSMSGVGDRFCRMPAKNSRRANRTKENKKMNRIHPLQAIKKDLEMHKSQAVKTTTACSPSTR